MLLFYILYKLDDRAKTRGWKRRFREWTRAKRENADPEQLGVEEARWFNLMVDRMWPQWSPLVDASARSFIGRLLNEDGVRPQSVSQFYVTKFVLGDTPPQVRNLHVIPVDNRNRFKINFDVSYNPEGDVLITAEMGVVKVPIRIQDFLLEGRMHVTLEFVSASPLIDYLEVGFIHHPTLDFGIQVAKLVDVMDFSFLNAWLNKLVVDSLSNYLVLPASLKFSIKSIMQPDVADTVKSDSSVASDFETYSQELAERFFHPEQDADSVNLLIRELIAARRKRMQSRAHKKRYASTFFPITHIRDPSAKGLEGAMWIWDCLPPA